jgi:hypothetical protein
MYVYIHLVVALLHVWSAYGQIWWIGSQEGISMQMYNLDLLYGLSLEKIFDIKVVPFHNKKHYPDMDNIELCTVFAFPQSITCPTTVNLNRTALAVQHDCAVLRRPHTDLKTPLPAQERWYFVPRTYNLEPHYPISYDTSDVLDAFPWGQDGSCFIGSPAYLFDSVPFSAAATKRSLDQSRELPIVFTPYYVKLLEKALSNLGWKGSKFAAAHWRRGDQLIMRCAPNDSRKGAGANGLVSVLDSSVNCAPVGEFVETFLRDCCRSSSKDVGTGAFNLYVATNEKKPAVVRRLKQLSNGNIKVFSDLGFGSSLSSLDRFVVEVLLMIHADSFHRYGVSAVHILVDRARAQRELPQPLPHHALTLG